jgi:hypothetical protein
MNAVQTNDDRQQSVATLIGESGARFAVGGRIRAGVKVLTTSAAQEPRAKALYDAGVAAGRSFDDIEAEIVRAVPELRHPLVPKNVPYFTVRRGDFAMPELADRMVMQFGEDRGDGVVRLYRFPVVFPADRWESIMPHALMCYGASELKYWSSYSADGRERSCMTFAPVPVDSGKRAIRIFGGRRHVKRDANGGRCEPESCPEYQARQCNLTGRFIFLIPGISSIHPIELATNSFYAMNAARQTLETVGFLRGGRIGGFLDGRTSFWITKRLHEVSMIGEDGAPRRVPQWLIELEAPIDLTRLLAVDSDEARIEQAERAVALLTGAFSSIADRSRDAESDAASAAAQVERPDDAPPTGSRLPPNGPTTAAGVTVGGGALDQVFERVNALQLSREAFESYAKRKYGGGWSLNPSGIRRVLRDLQADGASLMAGADGALDLVK